MSKTTYYRALNQVLGALDTRIRQLRAEAFTAEEGEMWQTAKEISVVAAELEAILRVAQDARAEAKNR